MGFSIGIQSAIAGDTARMPHSVKQQIAKKEKERMGHSENCGRKIDGILSNITLLS
jgi:hypothetical protein